jgi:hypothetical protein
LYRLSHSNKIIVPYEEILVQANAAPSGISRPFIHNARITPAPKRCGRPLCAAATPYPRRPPARFAGAFSFGYSFVSTLFFV